METLKNEFAQSIPEKLMPGILYVSMERSVAIHLCACGCGNEVVTPLSPVDWQLTYDGKAISLSPSIGNWNFKCRSHYWIIDNKIKWSAGWSKKQIEESRNFHRETRKVFESEREEIPKREDEPLVVPKDSRWTFRKILEFFGIVD
jgi:hypothetical protein